ncbi:DUF2087 domain-containing protein [Paenibacillus sp. NPDC058071]|uniref:DUF2087 domain-containing protein n=1 Tax=Paenibacillus sp. NPDC058071 TaxID=3346326 RepID=UPI0036DD491A
MNEHDGSPAGAAQKLPRLAERYPITEEDQAKWTRIYLPDGPDGSLSQFPRKDKRKAFVLRHIAASFEPNRTYTEKEVNELLKRYWAPDFVAIRRYLVDWGFLTRTDDCQIYRLNDSHDR